MGICRCFGLVQSGEWGKLDLAGYVTYHSHHPECASLQDTAFLYAVEILPLQYRSQVQASANLVFWFMAFLSAYFGGQAAIDPAIGAKIYIWFCLGGALFTILAWIFVVESK